MSGEDGPKYHGWQHGKPQLPAVTAYTDQENVFTEAQTIPLLSKIADWKSPDRPISNMPFYDCSRILINDPPVGPLQYALYVVGGTPTGAWVGHGKQFAVYVGTTWYFFEPAGGTIAHSGYNSTANEYYAFRSFPTSGWFPIKERWGINPWDEDVSAGNNRLTDLDAPVDLHDASNKEYVDLVVQNLEWQNKVIDYLDLTTAEPVAPNVGDRYINTVSGVSSQTGQGVYINRIYEWNGTDWTETDPQEGYATWVDNLDECDVFNGTDWVKFGSTVSHNNTSGLQGGTTNEYYHLTDAEHETLVDGTDDAGSLHNHAGEIATHTALPNAHHSQAHDIDGADHTGTLSLDKIKSWTTRVINVDNKRVDTYTPDGTAMKPYKTIAAALTYIAGLASAEYLTLKIADGVYAENIVLEDAGFKYIKIQGDGYVSINPAAGNALQSTATNDNLKALHMDNIVLAKSAVITGANGAASFLDVMWSNVSFTSGTLVATCINNLSMRNVYSEIPFQFVNVNWSYIESGQLQGTFAFTMDSTLAVPSQGKDGTILANGVFQSGTVSYTIGGTATYTVAPTGCRWGSGAVTVPVGVSILAYASFLRGTVTNNGAITLRNSTMQGYVAGTGTLNLDGQPASQYKNDSGVAGTTVKDALDTLNGKIVFEADVNLAGVAPVNADVAAWADGDRGMGIGTGGREFLMVKRGVTVKYVELS